MMTMVYFEMFIIFAIILMAGTSKTNSSWNSATAISISETQALAIRIATKLKEELKGLSFFGDIGGPGGPPGGPGGPPGGPGGPPGGPPGGWGYGAGGWGYGPGIGPGYFGPYGGPGTGGYGQYSPYYGPNGYGPGGSGGTGRRAMPRRQKIGFFKGLIEWSQYAHDVDSLFVAGLLVFIEIIGGILFLIGLIVLFFML